MSSIGKLPSAFSSTNQTTPRLQIFNKTNTVNVNSNNNNTYASITNLNSSLTGISRPFTPPASRPGSSSNSANILQLKTNTSANVNANINDFNNNNNKLLLSMKSANIKASFQNNTYMSSMHIGNSFNNSGGSNSSLSNKLDNLNNTSINNINLNSDEKNSIGTYTIILLNAFYD